MRLPLQALPLPSLLTLKLAIASVCALALVLLLADRNHWKAEAAHRQQQLADTKAAFDQTAAGYHAAAERARWADAENARRVTAEQTAISERTADEYQTRIAAARAAADRLRAQLAATADSSAGGRASVPRLPAPTGGIAEATGQDQLPQADGESDADSGPLNVPDRLIATEQAIQLDELIKWVRSQSSVDPNRAAAAVDTRDRSR